MATSGELIKCVSDVTGVPETTVATYFRSLREGGHVSKSGRGPSAAKMTFDDAANLLAACVGPRFEREPAEKIVRSFQTVRAVESTHWNSFFNEEDRTVNEGRWVFEGFELPELQHVSQGHSFIEAISALLRAASADAFNNSFEKHFPGTEFYYAIRVEVQGPRPYAVININVWAEGKGRYTEEVVYQLEQQAKADPSNYLEIEKMLKAEFGSGDLSMTRELTHRTIFDVAKLISGGAS